MRRLYFIGSLVIVLLFVPAVRAETTDMTATEDVTVAPVRTITPVGKQMQEIRQEAKNEAKEVRTETRATVKDALQERQVSLATIRTNYMVQRYEAAITRFANILERVQSRIEKMGTVSNTAVVKTHLDAAQKAIDSARSALDIIKSTAASAEVDVSITAFLEDFKTIRQYLLDAHKELRATVVALKTVQNAVKPTLIKPVATTSGATPETTEGGTNQ